jgi:transmembrane sensor
MKDSYQSNQKDHVVTEACAWIAQLETGELSSADVEAFREWTNRSSQHAAEINRLVRLSADLNLLSELADPLREATANYAPVLSQKRQNKSQSFPPLLRMGGLAAAAALIVVVVIALMQPAVQNEPFAIATPVGGYLEQELQDGTLVRLNTNTELTVAYEDQLRKVYLHKGEAYFQVAPDSSQPFVVQTNTREVLAVGTAFVVRLQDKHIKVMVTEGRVAISQNVIEHQSLRATGQHLSAGNSSASATSALVSRAPILLQAGQTFEDSIETGTQPITRVAEVELQRRLAWQRGLIDFSDTPLRDVVREVTRYTSLSIVVEDPQLQEMQFGGIFPTGEVNLLFDVLETRYGISVSYLDDSTVLLSPVGDADSETSRSN